MRASGNFESVIRGVSEQVPHERAVGQHTEQVNMLSDPVKGLTRRHGSRLIGEFKMTDLDANNMPTYITDTGTWRTVEGSVNRRDYVVFYRSGSRPAGSDLPVCIIYCKQLNKFLPLLRNAVDAPLDLLESGGVSAATFVGRYLMLAGNDVVTSGTEVPLWETPDNLSKAVIWIRGGAPGRTFKAIITKTDGTTINYSVTTSPMTYDGALNTSDIPYSAPDYTKQVNDRVNAYNSAVTAQIRLATFEAQPSNMAVVGAAQLTALGVSATAKGSHIILTGVRSVAVNDGGDGTLLRGVADEVESVDKLSPIHFANKVVKVRTANSEEAFYMKAVPKNPSDSGATEVTWVECAGIEYRVTQALFFATTDDLVNQAYIASSPALLNAILPMAHPDYAVSVAGDHDSNPAPYVANRKITYLATFQDRLLLGSGGVVVCSKVGDYLNFFRSTVLTVPADDAFEMKSQGPEDDILRHSVLYDQSLIIFGDKRQYMISGKVALSPTNASMPVMASYSDTAECPPHAAGGSVFYSKHGAEFASIHELRPGQGLQNSPESYPASSQIDRYLEGKVIEMASNASPSTLFLRTTGSRNSLYTFGYVDSPQGRKLDNWSRWDFDTSLGPIIGMTSSPSGVLVYYLRVGHDGVYTVVDECLLTTGLSSRPYLDSQRSLATVESGTGSVRLTSTGNWIISFDNSTVRRFLGAPLAQAEELQDMYPTATGLWVGAPQVAYFEPTNPYMVDGKGKAILSGRLTITGLALATDDSAGMVTTLTVNGLSESITYTGRSVGELSNPIGIEHVSSDRYNIPIGRGNTEYSLRVSARQWLPLTVTGIEWSGQFFNRTQRF